MVPKILLLTVIIFTSVEALSHARLVSPVPRNLSAGIKTGPCGGIARTATPTVLNPGQQLPISITETIDHPGRFYVEFSPANDANWVRLLTIPDNQNSPPVPHTFTGTVTIPATPCTACTLRIIQSMEENPASPSLYYSCADIVVSSTATPSPTAPPGGGSSDPGKSSGSGNANESAPRMGGCGTIGGSSGRSGGSAWWFLGFPFVVLFRLRRRLV